MDFLTKKQRSKLMSRIRSVSKLELRAKKQAEAAAGCRLRHGGRKSGLPGSPDWYNKSKKTVVFIHGCFWHGCDEHGSQPKTNAEFWMNKIANNRRRDAENLKSYSGMGWTAIVLWEHSLKPAKL